MVALITLIMLFGMPIIILVDSKRRLGWYSFGWAIITLLGMFGAMGSLGRQFRASGGDAALLLGGLVGACAGSFALYRSMTRQQAQDNSSNPGNTEAARVVAEKETTTSGEPNQWQQREEAVTKKNKAQSSMRSVSAPVEGAEEKVCPKCAETIKMAALVCRYCGHEFDEAEVSRVIATRKREIEERERETQEKIKERDRQQREAADLKAQKRAATHNSLVGAAYTTLGAICVVLGGLALLVVVFAFVTPPSDLTVIILVVVFFGLLAIVFVLLGFLLVKRGKGRSAEARELREAIKRHDL